MATKPKTKTYRLVARQHSGFDEDGNVKDYKTGDKVPLTETQFEAFGDKFEPLTKEEADDEPVLTPAAPAVRVNPEGSDKVQTTEDKQKAVQEGKQPAGPSTGAGAAQNSTNAQKVK